MPAWTISASTDSGQWATAAPLVTCDCDIVALPGTRSPTLAVLSPRGGSGQLFIVISAVYIQSKHSAPDGRGLRREREGNLLERMRRLEFNRFLSGSA